MNGAFVFGFWKIWSYLAELRWQPALLRCGNIGLLEQNPRSKLMCLRPCVKEGAISNDAIVSFFPWLYCRLFACSFI